MTREPGGSVGAEEIRSLIVSGAANVPATLVKRVGDVLNAHVCIIFGQTESNGPITITAPSIGWWCRARPRCA